MGSEYWKPYQDRRELRATVWEVSGARCEHPIRIEPRITGTPRLVACEAPATEMAHVFPRGMGHHGYRDSLSNVIAACDYHARSTDDMSHEAWKEIGMDRQGLVAWVASWRSKHRGWKTA